MFNWVEIMFSSTDPKVGSTKAAVLWTETFHPTQAKDLDLHDSYPCDGRGDGG